MKVDEEITNTEVNGDISELLKEIRHKVVNNDIEELTIKKVI
ncbi:MAG: hypothetical protein ACYCS1_05430 [Gammaproteobacteria bacterium]